MRKNYFCVKYVFALVLGGLGLTGIVSAHAVVTPKQAGIASYQNFSLGLPSEKDASTIAVRLLIPDGLQSVTPNVKPGWKIEIKKNGSAEDAVVTEIDWTGGIIPTGQRDVFLFSAKMPAKPTTLNWKVYQNYSDNSVISWDGNPASAQPYSQTMVVDDLQMAPAPTNAVDNLARRVNSAIGFSIVALALAVVALARSRRRNG